MPTRYEVRDGIAFAEDEETKGIFQGLQRAWNTANASFGWASSGGTNIQLIVDGKLGENTLAAVQMVFSKATLRDPRTGSLVDRPDDISDLALNAKRLARAIAHVTGDSADFTPAEQVVIEEDDAASSGQDEDGFPWRTVGLFATLGVFIWWTVRQGKQAPLTPTRHDGDFLRSRDQFLGDGDGDGDGGSSHADDVVGDGTGIEDIIDAEIVEERDAKGRRLESVTQEKDFPWPFD